MIVVSGSLVAVALVLLVVGLKVSLGYIYASIGVSVLAFVVLGLAARQRRAAPATAVLATAAPDRALRQDAAWSELPEPADRDPAGYADPDPLGWQPPREVGLPGWRSGPEPEPPVEDDDDLLEDEDLLGGERYGGTVLVVPGRPRYHVPGCRYLQGKESADLDVLDAREEGFRPCGICRPDVVLAEELSEAELVAELGEQRRDVVHLEPGAAAYGDELDLLDLPVDDGPPGHPGLEHMRPAPVATKRRPASSRIVPEPGAEPVRRSADRPHAAAPPVEDVVLVPERGRYHRPTCRYARGVASAQRMGADAARAAGHQPCGICKP